MKTEKATMPKQGYTIAETDWGLHVVNTEGLIIDPANDFRRIEHIIGKCHKASKKKILLETQTNFSHLSIMTAFRAVERMLELRARGFLLAVVLDGYADNNELKFMENVGFNRLIFIKFFDHKDKAVKWLTKK